MAVGNPARVVKSLEAFLDENRQKMGSDNVFNEQYRLRNPSFDDREREELLDACKRYGVAFVE